jgi:rod shape-determining protein MreC
MAMLRLSQPNRRTDFLVFLLFLVISVVLLTRPEGQKITIADRLRHFLTEPFFRVRDFVEDVVRVRQENASLLARIAELELQAAAQSRHRRDQERIAAAARFEGQFSHQLFPCEVVARRRGRYAQMIKIRSTEPTDWQPYLPVVSPAGLLGRIRKITDSNTAWVELLTARDMAVGCEIERTGLLGVLRPSSGGFILGMVGRDEDVQKGDRIITSGIAEVRQAEGQEPNLGRMPRGLPVGVVSSVSRPPNELFKKISVEPYASFKYNEMVFIVGAQNPAGAIRESSPSTPENRGGGPP